MTLWKWSRSCGDPSRFHGSLRGTDPGAVDHGPQGTHLRRSRHRGPNIGFRGDIGAYVAPIDLGCDRVTQLVVDVDDHDLGARRREPSRGCSAQA